MRTLLVAVLAAMALPAHAMAQRNPHRQGLWGELSSGPSRLRIGCSGCSGVTVSNGTGGVIRIGGVLSPKVLLGVEFSGFTDKTFGFSSQDTTIVANASATMAVVLWYPWRRHFFVKSGIGVAGGEFTVMPDTGQAVVAQGAGVGMTFGLGFDVPLSRKYAITANLGAFISAVGDIQLPGRTVDDVIPTTYLLSIGFTWR